MDKAMAASDSQPFPGHLAVPGETGSTRRYGPEEEDMQTVEETIEVAVPVREAYEQWSQFESLPQFMSGVQSVTRVSDRITHWVTNIGGAEREFDAETVEDLQDERIAWRSTDGISHAGAVTFTQLGPRTTRIWVRLEWSPENLGEQTGATLGFDNMQVRADLRRFKEFIESRGSGTDA
jgi:uncharacterized membrane protein